MTRDDSLISSFTSRKRGFVSYGENKGKVIGIGTIGKFPNLMIMEVLLVDGLKNNLLSSISQLCGKGNNVSFDSSI